jgi:hypothetical protein
VSLYPPILILPRCLGLSPCVQSLVIVAGRTSTCPIYRIFVSTASTAPATAAILQVASVGCSVRLRLARRLVDFSPFVYHTVHTLFGTRTGQNVSQDLCAPAPERGEMSEPGRCCITGVAPLARSWAAKRRDVAARGSPTIPSHLLYQGSAIDLSCHHSNYTGGKLWASRQDS